jgi:hypothetical protein
MDGWSVSRILADSTKPRPSFEAFGWIAQMSGKHLEKCSEMDKRSPLGEEAAKKPYSVDVRAKALSSTSCSFCWFILTINPTLKGMTHRDSALFREHLKRAHGLMQEIQP